MRVMVTTPHRAFYDETVEKISRLEAELADLAAQHEAALQLVQLMVETYPDLKDDEPLAVAPASTMSTRDFMKATLGKAGEWMTARQLHGAMIADGWQTKSKMPMDIIRNELGALAKKGEIESRDRGDRLGTKLYRARREQSSMWSP